MQLQGYIKVFDKAKGDIETIFDADVINKKSSWRHGRFVGLKAVVLHHGLADGRRVSILVDGDEGEWWTSDTLISRYRSNTTSDVTFLERRIQKRLKNEDVGRTICVAERPKDTYRVVLVDSPTRSSGQKIKMISPRDIGKWLCVTLVLRNEEKDYSIAINLNQKKI